MSTTPMLHEALEIALKLSPGERLQLIEQVASSVQRELTQPAETSSGEHWGQALNQLRDSLDMSEWEAIEMDDPVEWVKQQRDEEYQRRLKAWDDD